MLRASRVRNTDGQYVVDTMVLAHVPATVDCTDSGVPSSNVQYGGILGHFEWLSLYQAERQKGVKGQHHSLCTLHMYRTVHNQDWRTVTLKGLDSTSTQSTEIKLRQSLIPQECQEFSSWPHSVNAAANLGHRSGRGIRLPLT